MFLNVSQKTCLWEMPKRSSNQYDYVKSLSGLPLLASIVAKFVKEWKSVNALIFWVRSGPKCSYSESSGLSSSSGHCPSRKWENNALNQHQRTHSKNHQRNTSNPHEGGNRHRVSGNAYDRRISDENRIECSDKRNNIRLGKLRSFTHFASKYGDPTARTFYNNSNV